MRERLTDERIKTIKPAPPGKRIDIFDALVSGLVLRVTDRGVKSFALRYRLNGRTLRFTLGKTPPLKLKWARAEATSLMALARQGTDPMQAKRERKLKLDQSAAMDTLIEQFIRRLHQNVRERTMRPDYVLEVERLLRREVMTKWKGWGAAAIGAAQATALLDGLESRGSPSTHRHTYYALKGPLCMGEASRLPAVPAC